MSHLLDRLNEAQRDLQRGQDGTEKLMSCSAALLAKLAEIRPRDAAAMTRILGDARADRFGARFLEILHDDGG